MKPSHPANDNLKNDLIGHTRQVWQRRVGRNLSHEDVRQIAENVTGFFALLAKWSRAEAPTAANDNNVGTSTPLVGEEGQPTDGRDRGGRGHD
jgi:hypothetical protein